MSKLYELYKEIKKDKENSVILFKSGIFYVALAEDAVFLSEKIGLKLTYFNGEIYKCGFPVSRFDFYSHLLDELSIEYIVKDNAKSANTVCNPELSSIVNYVTNIDINSITVQEAFDILKRVQNMLRKITPEDKNNE